MDGLKVDVLGPPRVTVDGAPLRVDTRKAVALLGILAVDGPRSRGSLAALLWPESDTSRARGALRRTLSVLTHALDGRGVVAEETVRFDTDAVTVDAAEVAGLLERVADHDETPEQRCDRCLADLKRTVELHRGELLEGFGLRDSTLFDDWRTERAEHVRRRLVGVFDLLTTTQLRRGVLDGALDGLERWLVIDPLNEEVHTRLMLLHAWRGERAEAVRRYRACVAVLDVELGVAPLARTTQVYQAILQGRVRPAVRSDATDPVVEAAEIAPVRSPARTPHPGRHEGWPLVGRDEVLDELAAVVTNGAVGARRLTVVTGEAGVGKTRLADALRQRLEAAGRPPAAARCFAGETGLAFGPFVDLLRQVIDRMPASRLTALPAATVKELHRLVPAHLANEPDPRVELAPLDSPGARAVFFAAIWDVLDAALADIPPGVVVLDELQAIDPSSIQLLGYGLHRLADRDLAVVLCLRAEDAPAELLALLDDPAVAGIAHRVDLPRLVPDDAAALVAAVVPDTDPSLAERLYAESEGLPLLLAEYLRLIVDGEVAVDDGGQGWLLPRGARELARSRLAGLSDTATQIASAAATFGRSFDLEVVRAASGRTATDVVDGIDELLARRLVRELRGDTSAPEYDFVHDKLRAAIYEGTSLARRRLLHGRIADALAPLVRRDAHRAGGAAAVAEHARLADRDDEAARWHAVAAEQARRLFANEEAYRHLEQAIALGHPDVWRLRLQLGEVATLLGHYPAALATFEAAAAGAVDDATLAMTELRIAGVYLRRGELALAGSHLTAARQLVDDGTPTTARIEADLGLLRLREGHLADAVAHAEQALALASDGGDVEGRAQALNLLGLVARHEGDPAAARDHLAASVQLAEGLADPAAYVAALNNLALATAEAGDVEGAVDLQQRAVERGARYGDRHREAALRNNLADLLHLAGRDDEALATLEGAVGLFASIDTATDPSPEIWKLVDW
ncbi:ATP-binding protein [Nitriliruptor alkaliphilus]|uniref:ATP-binding protein n=1 Tax=Nitriliruptor alkaliphilus TaxID=427918 RepID=UPI000695E4E0|nr:tetratricopeptide repeat protein [Nitriliruptor alkaliphilus]